MLCVDGNNMAQLEISVNDYWKATLKTAEATLDVLLLFEGKNVQGVDKAIASLRDLIAGGSDFNKVRQPQQSQQPEHLQQLQQPKQLQQQYYQQQSRRSWYSSPAYDVEPEWTTVSAGHIQVPLSNGQMATCIAVSTEEQLDQAISEIKQASYIAIDCEFQSAKKTLPELKLLQVGVSSKKGFAIQVDIIGVDTLSQKLKPILEDEHMNIVGWSYRSDALAIESFFKDIVQAPVLDLQAKFLPVAVETLNLEAAMVKFADKWEGLEAFRKAKHYGEGFYYKDDDCIWTKNPLPPKALVYSVFDVLSVHALHEYTAQYTNKEKFYWPYTITNNQSEKSINRLHQQRAIGISSPAPSPGKSPTPPFRGNPGKAPSRSHWNANYRSTSPTYRRNDHKQRQKEEEYVPVSPQPETDDGYDDNDPRFTKELQQAIILSVKESAKAEYHAYGGESSSNGASAASGWQDDNPVAEYNDNEQDSSNPSFTDAPVDPPVLEADYRSWGEFDPSSQPFFGSENAFASPNLSKAEANGSDYGPPAVASPASVAAVTPADPLTTPLSVSVPVRQPMPAPTAASPQFQHRFSRPSHAMHQNKQQSSPSAQQQQQQYPDQQHLPAPVTFAPRSNYNVKRSPRKTFNNIARAPPPQSQSAPPVAESTASSGSAGFGSKPKKEKYATDFKNRVMMGDQNGAFTWSQDATNGVGTASWTSFASSAGNKWDQGIDSNMTDWELAKQNSQGTTPQTTKMESIKFNTVVSSTAGGGGQNAPKNGVDNWASLDKRPDTMEMMMNQIPIRKKFSGPRTMHPDDGDSDTEDNDDDDDDDDDDDNDNDNDVDDDPYFNRKRSSQKDIVAANVGLRLSLLDTQTSKSQKALEKLPIFVDYMFPYSFKSNQELAMFTLTKFEHLDMIIIPDEPFSVTICFHIVESKTTRFTLKALQLYLSTGESYTCVLEKACEILNKPRFQSTAFGRLLSDPTIKRVCWYPEFIEDSLVQILGFSLGPTTDLAVKVIEDHPLTFAGAVKKYLADMPDTDMYFELKEGYDKSTAIGKKFGGSCWEKQKLPEEILKYCALQGLIAYTLYQKVNELGIEDDANCLYPNNEDDDSEEYEDYA
ncbi:hypothetical protein BD408DRAFT_422679 [Parasitella parasitica]|nr:hypothetical protein BD408DRAFT_422679 [Parasitella parasitica]